MTFLDRLERLLGHFAIPGLIRYVAALTGLVYLLGYASPDYLSYLVLSPEKVMHGEVWRLISWIFVPGEGYGQWGPIWMAVGLMFLWFMGDIIEGAWGTFRLNAFYFTGILACTLAAMLLPGAGTGLGANMFLNLSLILAVGTLVPDMQVLLFFIIPLKMKWLAWFSVVLFALAFPVSPAATQAAMLISVGNYLLFFGPAFLRNRRRAQKTAVRRAQFEQAAAPAETLHRCEVCGRTEVSN
ncbi:MAG TPA: hypothetical protein VIS74_02245, partial [Chthoniobacterales bacterium]